MNVESRYGGKQMLDPVSLMVGGTIISTIWGGSYAGAASKPKNKRRRNPVETANKTTLFTAGVLGAINVAGPAAAATFGAKSAAGIKAVAATKII